MKLKNSQSIKNCYKVINRDIKSVLQPITHSNIINQELENVEKANFFK